MGDQTIMSRFEFVTGDIKSKKIVPKVISAKIEIGDYVRISRPTTYTSASAQVLGCNKCGIHWNTEMNYYDGSIKIVVNMHDYGKHTHIRVEGVDWNFCETWLEKLTKEELDSYEEESRQIADDVMFELEGRSNFERDGNANE